MTEHFTAPKGTPPVQGKETCWTPVFHTDKTGRAADRQQGKVKVSRTQKQTCLIHSNQNRHVFPFSCECDTLV